MTAALALVPLGHPHRFALETADFLVSTGGAYYDRTFTEENRRKVYEEVAAYTVQTAEWRTNVAPLYELLDRTARTVEQRELTANTGRSLNPRLVYQSGRVRAVLAPELSAALTFPDGYDEEPAATASLVLTTGGPSPLPIVRLTARDPGRAGNRL